MIVVERTEARVVRASSLELKSALRYHLLDTRCVYDLSDYVIGYLWHNGKSSMFNGKSLICKTKTRACVRDACVRMRKASRGTPGPYIRDRTRLQRSLKVVPALRVHVCVRTHVAL
jgi:hypothetical protein